MPQADSQNESMLVRLKRKHEKTLLRKQNVLGCGVGFKECGGKLTDQLALVLYVTPKRRMLALAPEDRIPPEIEGIPTDAQELIAFPEAHAVPSIGASVTSSRAVDCLEKQKQRCLDLWFTNRADVGLSTPICLEELKLATAACRLYEKALEERPREQTRENFVGQPGSSIGRYNGNIDDLYPGAMKLMRTIRALKRRQQKHEDTDHLVGGRNVIPDLGAIQGTAGATLGSIVYKRGRTTGLTKGSVRAIDVSIFVDYPIGIAQWQKRMDIGQPIFSPSPSDGGKFPRDVTGYVSHFVPLNFVINEEPELYDRKFCSRARAFFVEQVTADLSVRPGDSGSLVVDEGLRAVGLVFAGTKNLTFYSPYDAVSEVLG